jgi:hypothetical protein
LNPVGSRALQLVADSRQWFVDHTDLKSGDCCNAAGSAGDAEAPDANAAACPTERAEPCSLRPSRLVNSDDGGRSIVAVMAAWRKHQIVRMLRNIQRTLPSYFQCVIPSVRSSRLGLMLIQPFLRQARLNQIRLLCSRHLPRRSDISGDRNRRSSIGLEDTDNARQRTSMGYGRASIR